MAAKEAVETWGESLGVHSVDESSIINKKLTASISMDSGNRRNKFSTIPEQVSMLQVYVGNWPSNVNKSELQKLIKSFDYCGGCIVTSSDSSQGKYGFEDFKYLHEANRMIESLYGRNFKGRNLEVCLGKNDNAQDMDGQKYLSHHLYRNGLSDEAFEEEFCNFMIDGNDAKKYLTAQPSPLISNGNFLQSHHSKDVLDQISPQQKHVASMQTQESYSDEMPHLEKLVFPKMPKLESYPEEIPPLMKLVLTKRKSNLKKHCSSNFQYLQTEQNFLRNGIADIYDAGDDVEEDGKVIQKNGVHQIQLNICNFPYGTSEADLENLFTPFGVKSIVMMNNCVTCRSTHAFALFSDISKAQSAMLSLDQCCFRRRKLNVTFATPVGQYRAFPSNSPVPQILSGNMAQHEYDLPDNVYTSKQTSGPVVLRKMTNTFRDYRNTVIKLHCSSEFDLSIGSTLKVMITHVENDKFFWGQVLASSVQGVSVNMSRFEELSIALQYNECRTNSMTALGRCTALFGDTWYRCWCTDINEMDGELCGNVLYIDYGNTEVIPLKEIFHTNVHAGLWQISCMAKPFKLLEPKANLQSLINKVVFVEVVETGIYTTNFVTTVCVQWDGQ